MHKSRLGTVVIDCQTEQVDSAAAFWSGALGWPARPLPDQADPNYRLFETPPSEVTVLVQAVSHPSRVHIDIETDDVEAEAARLIGLGATVVAHPPGWFVLRAPGGHLLCVVPIHSDPETFAKAARTWP